MNSYNKQVDISIDNLIERSLVTVDMKEMKSYGAKVVKSGYRFS